MNIREELEAKELEYLSPYCLLQRKIPGKRERRDGM